MKSIARKASVKLEEWKHREKRKPLLLRGARQVGKTTLVREFSKGFDSYIELNLERLSDRNLFNLEQVKDILNAACLLKGKEFIQKTTLLFIDEIQESPKAIQQLRYFYEDLPNLHVIAAGSLLEFALKEVPSFPVGRVEYLYLHPLSFEEYLGAIGNSAAEQALKTVPVPNYAHDTLMKLFNEYTIVGGMPEIVDEYRKARNMTVLGRMYRQLWQAYKDDIEKYAKSSAEKQVLRHVIETAAFETDRIKFEGFGNSNYRSREVGEALRALDLAKVVRLIYPTTALKPPISPDFKKRPRLQFLDTGMLTNILNLQGEMIGLLDLNDLNRGKIIQHIVAQELIAKYDELPYKPHFWVREKKTANSEVDFVVQYKDKILPVEVKSGKQGRLRSLHQFIEQSDVPLAVRIYGGNFRIEDSFTPNGKEYRLMNLPYYLGSMLSEYITLEC